MHMLSSRLYGLPDESLCGGFGGWATLFGPLVAATKLDEDPCIQELLAAMVIIWALFSFTVMLRCAVVWHNQWCTISGCCKAYVRDRLPAVAKYGETQEMLLFVISLEFGRRPDIGPLVARPS